jgi:hypothetical protein
MVIFTFSFDELQDVGQHFDQLPRALEDDGQVFLPANLVCSAKPSSDTHRTLAVVLRARPSRYWKYRGPSPGPQRRPTDRLLRQSIDQDFNRS